MPKVKSHADRLAEEQAARDKLQQAQQASMAKLDDIAQFEAQRQSDREAREHEMQLFDERVQRSRASGQTVDPTTMLNLDGYWTQKRAQEVVEAEAAEAARIAAIPPERLKRSTLPYAEQVRRNTWEAINGAPWPSE